MEGARREGTKHDEGNGGEIREEKVSGEQRLRKQLQEAAAEELREKERERERQKEKEVETESPYARMTRKRSRQTEGGLDSPAEKQEPKRLRSNTTLNS